MDEQKAGAGAFWVLPLNSDGQPATVLYDDSGNEHHLTAEEGQEPIFVLDGVDDYPKQD